MSLEICTLGTASGLPAPDRFGQTIVLTAFGESPRHYVLDAGDGASSLLTRNGFDHRDIAAVLVSHMHADHHAGFAQVIKTAMHLERREELWILAPAEGIPALKAYLDASYLLEEWLGYPLRWIALSDCVDRSVEAPAGLEFRAYPNEHLAWNRERAKALRRAIPFTFESYSVSLQGTGGRVVYSGNLHGPQGSNEMASFAEPCDLLITELAHVDPVELGRFLSDRAIGHTVVTHFHPRWNGTPDDELAALIHGAGGRIRGRLSLARDGERFSV